MTVLRVGAKYFSEGAGNRFGIYEGDKAKFRVDGLDDLYSADSRFLKRFAADIDTVEVGFCDIVDLDFLRQLPNAKKVWVLTSRVKDISGLRHCPQLCSLAIERPTCRMDVLGELTNLEEVHLDNWRPGADSLFHLTKLRSVRIRRYPYPDLTNMSRWRELRTLWLAYGGLETLDGIPDCTTVLELAQLRKLRSIDGIRSCRDLNRLIIQSCRSLTSLIGIESCLALDVLSVFQMGTLTDLHPIRYLPHLTYLVLTEFAGLLERDEGVLDNLSSLRTLIISKKLGIPIERLQKVLPNADTRLAT
jgi:Leucine-rich repeat (LRR) protein